MSHVLAVAAEIVGAVALVATGIGAIGGAIGLSAGVLQAAAVVSKIAIVAEIAISAASYLIPKPNLVNPMAWRADPTAGIPYAMGRTYPGGNVVLRLVAR